MRLVILMNWQHQLMIYCLQADVVFSRRNPKVTREMAEARENIFMIELFFAYYGNKIEILKKMTKTSATT
uniref:NR LBD domain-containing protein n=1 Tax=Heterorhabditis bacteriophora TaxID=37862 RepID=A0A1I7WQM8_HETBA